VKSSIPSGSNPAW